MSALPQPFREQVRQAIGVQWGYLRRFAEAIGVRLDRIGSLTLEAIEAMDARNEPAAPGFEPPITPAQIVARARLYVRAGWGRAQNAVRRAMPLVGMRWEKRVLGAANHCSTCVSVAGYWARAGTLPPIGDSECQFRCLCHFVYARGIAPPG